MFLLKRLLQFYQYAASKHFYVEKKPLPVLAALSENDQDGAKLLVKFSYDIANQMCAPSCSEEEWEFILTQAIQSSHRSLTYVPLKLALKARWKCMRYVLQERFVNHFDLNACPCYVDGTLLTNVAGAENSDLLEKLLNYDIDINKPNTDGTPLMHAVNRYMYMRESGGSEAWKTLKLLISNGCALNGLTLYPYTSVMKLIEPQLPRRIPEFLEVLEVFILAGASKCLLNKICTRCEETHATDEGIDRVKNIIQQSYEHVQSLKHLSRLSMRAALITNNPIKVHKLKGKLPPVLLDYLMFPDIADIEIKYGGVMHKCRFIYSGDYWADLGLNSDDSSASD